MPTDPVRALEVGAQLGLAGLSLVIIALLAWALLKSRDANAVKLETLALKVDGLIEVLREEGKLDRQEIAAQIAEGRREALALMERQFAEFNEREAVKDRQFQSLFKDHMQLTRESIKMGQENAQANRENAAATERLEQTLRGMQQFIGYQGGGGADPSRL